MDAIGLYISIIDEDRFLEICYIDEIGCIATINYKEIRSKLIVFINACRLYYVRRKIPWHMHSICL